MKDFDLDWDLNPNTSDIIGKTRSSGIKKRSGFLEREKSKQTYNTNKGKDTSSILSKLKEFEKKSYSNNPSYNMNMLIQILSERKYGFPNPGDTFTFIYKAKTPNIIYDQHPISTILVLEPGRFVGFNHHLNMTRQYSGDSGRIMSNFYKILPEEMDTVLRINTKLILSS